jgi:hypothetical protein
MQEQSRQIKSGNYPKVDPKTKKISYIKRDTIIRNQIHSIYMEPFETSLYAMSVTRHLSGISSDKKSTYAAQILQIPKTTATSSESLLQVYCDYK